MKNIFLITISNPLMGGTWVPLAAGNLVSYCLKNKIVKENFNFYSPEYRPYCLELDDFHNKLKKSDIIGLSCYVWNQDINDSIAKLFKKYNPSGIVLYGGPNVPENFNDAMKFAEEKFFVDKFFIGPGEKNLLNFLINNSQEGTYSKNYFEITTDRKSYQISRNETLTPFQEGIFDHILSVENSVGVPLETTRGCPYSCAFCDWGGQSNSKIVKFDEDKIKKEIEYFLSYDSVHFIDFCDANYGIFERDVEIVQHICKFKNKLKSVSFSGFAKNGTPRIKQIQDLLSNNFSMMLNEIKISLQTMSDQTLETINRSNIKTEKLLNIIKSKDVNQKISGELIIGLPGETAESWLDTLIKSINIGIDSLKIHRLLVLPNVPINTEEYIQQNNITFKEFKVPHYILNGGSKNKGSILHVLKNFKSVENLKINRVDVLQSKKYETFKTVKNCISFDNNEFIKIHENQFWYNALIGSNFLKDYIKNLNIPLKEQKNMFFNVLDNMPFFKSMKDDYIKNISKVLIHDSEGLIEHYGEYFSIMMNQNLETYKIYNNLNIAISEIKQIYPDANFNHIKKFEGDNLLKLASVYGSLKDGI